MKRIVVLACILALGLSGCSTAVGNSLKKKQGSFTWNRRQRLIITVSGRHFVAGNEKFTQEIRKVLPGTCCWGTSLSLTYLVKKRGIERFHTILMVRPECLYDLENLEAEYPDLLPISTEKLKSYLKTYGYPLLYFSRDYTGMIRGVIIAREVTPSLAKLLIEKPILLDTLLQYKNGKLKKAEKSQKEAKKTFAWNPEDKRERVIVTITGKPRPRGIDNYDEFAQEIRKVVSTVDLWLAPSLLTLTRKKIKGRITTGLEIIKGCHSIFVIRPQCLYDFHNLEAEYPDLLPISTEKLESYLKTYGYPLLYFSLDYTGMLRGVILTWEVNPSLTKLLTEEPIPLDTPLQYKNGKLEKLEK